MNQVTYLLVEDQEEQALGLKKWLIKQAEPIVAEVLIADNLADGIRMSNEARPITTFLDIHIPLVKGGPVCADWRIVADGALKMIPPVIGVTGAEITVEMRIYCITERKMHNLFKKPFDDKFFSTLRNQTKLFASQLIGASGDAVLRAAGSEKANGSQT